MSDELDKLAAEGRAQKAEAASIDQQKQTRTQRYNRDVLFNSLSWYARSGWVVLAFPLGGALAFACSLLIRPGDVAYLIELFVLVLSFVVTRTLRPYFGLRAVAREAAWISTLPFPLINYLETLEGYASDGTLSVVLTWGDFATKDVSFVTEVLSSAGVAVTVSERAEVHTVSVPFKFRRGMSTNAHVVDWVHRAAPALIALNAKWKLKSVAVKASWH